jgi:putative flavoprotein involved in K+ transport
MPRIDTVIIGGGQAGLAMSAALAQYGVEHVVLEAGRVGERWRSERWDSLRLLTPRWLSRLAGWSDDDSDPHGFMDRREVIGYLERYANAVRAPIHTGVAVRSVEQRGSGYRIVTEDDVWTAAHVVIATGESQDPLVPDMSRHLAGGIHQVVPTAYRNPEQLEQGGVLVVGASATGIQLASEIHASGRPVTLSVGRHTRLPRTYRGRDILAWFHDMGVLDETVRDVRNLAASRNQPSMQLTGSSDHRTLDLRVLQAEGVRLVGRAADVRDHRMHFEDDVVETIAAAEVKLAGLRGRIDRYIEAAAGSADIRPAEPFLPVPLPDAPDSIHLGEAGIRTVVWATGFRRRYPWLRVPVLDSRGEIRHTEGVTPVPGLYVLGLNFMRRRSSSFLSGVGRDAEELARHLVELRQTHGRRRQRRAVA